MKKNSSPAINEYILSNEQWKQFFLVPKCQHFCPYIGSKNEQNDQADNKALNRRNDDCVCGLTSNEHHPKSSRPEEPKFSGNVWSCSRNAEFQKHTSFGEIVFQHSRLCEMEGARSKYLRLQGSHIEAEAYKRAIFNLLTDKDLWSMPEPRLIIEVTGTALDSDIKVDVDLETIEELKIGLVKAAMDAKAWVVTGGSNSGIMKLIGDEVAKYHRLDVALPCLGIASWGCVKKRELLMAEDYEIVYEINEEQDKDEYGFHLSHGHNFYLLVDNGRERIYGEEIHFRHDLIHHVSEQFSKINKTPVPIVMLALGGGIGTWRTFEECFGMAEDIKKTTPLVILYGFGGATDLLVDVYDRFVVNKETLSDENIHDFVAKLPSAQRVLKSIKNGQGKDGVINAKQQLEELSKRIKRTMEHLLKSPRNLLTVYRRGTSTATTGSGLKEAILFAAMESVNNASFEGSDDKQKVTGALLALQLARNWNAVETAKSLVSNYLANLKEVEENNVQLRDIVRNCLVSGQLHFLDLLCEKKIMTRGDYLLQKDVFEAYERAILMEASDNNQAYEFLNVISQPPPSVDNYHVDKRQAAFIHLGEQLAKLIGCFMENPLVIDNIYTITPSHVDQAPSEAKCKRWPCNRKNADLQLPEKLIPKYRDAFLLQLLLNHDEMAVEMWCNGRDLMGTALVGSILLKNLSKLARQNNKHSLADFYEADAKKWERRAEQVLHRCAELKQLNVSWLLSRSLMSWQGRSVFKIAFYGRCFEFVKHNSVQTKLRFIWFSRISAFTRSVWVYLAAIFPPGIVFLNFIPYDASNKSKIVEKTTPGPKKLDNKPKSGTKKVSPQESNISPFRAFEQSVLSGLNLGTAIKAFYSSTMVRFTWNTIFLVVFLLLFSSFILMGRLTANNISYLEACVLAWSACLLVDIVHETYADEMMVVNRMKHTPLARRMRIFLRTCVSDRFKIFNWNSADYYNAILPFFIGLLLAVSLIMRLHLSPVDYIYPRTTYALACLLFWLRSMQIFNVIRPVGIIVVYLAELLPTLFYFLVVYAFLLIAFSIPIYALIAPPRDFLVSFNTTVLDDSGVAAPITMESWVTQTSYSNANDFFILITKVVYNRLWNLVQFDFDNSRKAIEGVCPASKDEQQPITALPYIMKGDGSCETEFNFVAIVLYIVFIFAANIAWMNVLIATLSEKVGKMRKDAKKLSRFNYFVAVRTVYYRCWLPAPFSLLEICYSLLVFIVKQHKCGRKDSTSSSSNDIDFLDSRYGLANNVKLDELERQAAIDVLFSESNKNQDADEDDDELD